MENNTNGTVERVQFHDAFFAMLKVFLPECAAMGVHMFLQGYDLGVASTLAKRNE